MVLYVLIQSLANCSSISTSQISTVQIKISFPSRDGNMNVNFFSGNHSQEDISDGQGPSTFKSSLTRGW